MKTKSHPRLLAIIGLTVLTTFSLPAYSRSDERLGFYRESPSSPSVRSIASESGLTPPDDPLVATQLFASPENGKSSSILLHSHGILLADELLDEDAQSGGQHGVVFVEDEWVNCSLRGDVSVGRRYGLVEKIFMAPIGFAQGELILRFGRTFLFSQEITISCFISERNYPNLHFSDIQEALGDSIQLVFNPK